MASSVAAIRKLAVGVLRFGSGVEMLKSESLQNAVHEEA